MYSFRVILFITAIIMARHSFAQSVLSEGTWYKFSVEKEAVYKLTFDDLKTAGFPVGQLDPRTIQVFGNKGGMLPQSNAAPRDFDLVENPITVVGEEDGKFDNGDYILFYGYGPDNISYNEDESIFIFQNNKYSDFNYYFLTYGNGQGKRIQKSDNLGTDFNRIDTYTEGYFLEDGTINLLSSGRDLWSYMNNYSKSVVLPFSNLHPGGVTKVHVELMAQSLIPSIFNLSLDGKPIGELSVGSVKNFEMDEYKYTTRGKEVIHTFTVNNSILSGNLNKLDIQFEDKDARISKAYYKKIFIQTERKLIYENEQVNILTPQSKELGLVSFFIKGVPEEGGLKVWDLLENYEINDQQFTINNTTAAFGALGGVIKKYILFDPNTAPSPEFIGTIDNQDVKSYAAPDLLIIAPNAFKEEAERLAAFRRGFDGYSVEVAQLDQIYNEFSSGRQDISAIRDYIRFLYKKNPAKLKYVLLLGKGSFQYYPIDDPAYLPVYQSYNSLLPLSTYSSDDYYGFLEDDEGLWLEENSGNHTLEVAIGRIPATSIEELQNVINKLIHYSSNPKTIGNWRSKMLFISDDQDDNIHYKHSQELTTFIEANIQDFQIDRIYLGSYKQERSSVLETSPDAAKAILKSIEEGALLVNYTGHGNESQWMDEKVFSTETIEQLDNINNLPIFVTATCAFGRHDSPYLVSAAEKLLTNPNGGGIGIVTTSRPVYSSTNFDLNWALVNAFGQLYPENVTLGDIFKITKNNSFSGVNNRNFILLGDPSLKIAVPEYKISLAAISEDTLKARQHITLSGKIQDYQGHPVSNFNGTVEIAVMDKPVQKATKADIFNNPYEFSDYSSIIFKGKATVNNGNFSTNFTVPKDIDPKIGDGIIYLYAYDNSNGTDASSGIKISVGGTFQSPEEDFEGPDIEVFLGDETFRNGDLIGSNSLLLVHLNDESGINISGRSIGSNIIAKVNGREFNLNENYISDKDDFTSGWASYMLESLEPGNYTLTLQASDNLNNINAVSVDFVVADDSKLIIDELLNFPNPARDFTEFYFTHNRSGDPLEGKLTLLSNRGEKILEFMFETEKGQVRHKIMDWDCSSPGQSKIEPGVYYYRLDIRSKLDGAKAEKYQKLIILN